MKKTNLLKTVHFDHPDQVPVIFHINSSCWDHYPREELSRLIEDHPFLFPEGLPEWAGNTDPVPYADWCRKDEPWTDPWGCLWETSLSGYIGAVTRHPLGPGDSLKEYPVPDFMKTTHWYPVEWIEGRPPKGGSIGFFDCLSSGEIGHGHTFLKILDILGYENALLGMYDDSALVKGLLERIEAFNFGLAEQFVNVSGVEWLGYAEDLGMQTGPMLSPDMFHKYIMPSYQRIMKVASENDVIIHMHSDGDIRDLWPDISTLPIKALNIQDTVNGIDWIAENIVGKMTVDLDIDRQELSMSGSMEDIREHFAHIRKKLLRPEGGLILTYGLYPGVPLEKASVIMDCMQAMAMNEAL
jgi:uroporphyrinogen decarboxylase